MKNVALVALALVTLGTGCARIATPSASVSAHAERAVVRVKGEGIVASDGIDCGRARGEEHEACVASWVSFDSVQLSATPAPGWRFVGWDARPETLSPVRHDDAAGGGYVYEARFEKIEGAHVAAR